jgi:hypothetical protein
MIDTSKQVKSITYNGTPLEMYHKLQEKTIDVTANGTQSITPDTGYDGLSSVNVTVNVPSSGGGSSLLDNYSVAWENASGQLTAQNNSTTLKTRIVNSSTAYEYRYSFISNDIPVGANILDHINEVVNKYEDVYCWPLYVQRTSEVQKELTMNDIRSNNSQNICMRKYSGVTYSAVNTNYGNLIVYDKDGKCLFNGTPSDGIAALNNKTIDTSNGVCIGFTTYARNGNHCSVIFN